MTDEILTRILKLALDDDYGINSKAFSYAIAVCHEFEFDKCLEMLNECDTCDGRAFYPLSKTTNKTNQ
jgi:hypothetical protein